MIRHISIFTFLDTPEKQENIEAVRAFLEKIPDIYPAIRNCEVAVPAGPVPSLPDDSPVMFGDLIQILDYETPEDAAGYPASKAHTDLTELSAPMLKKVTAIDYIV